MSDGGFEQMSESTLIPELEEEPIVSRGHGVAALGPSDTSDSGSDITGGPGLAATGDFLELGGGTTSDLDVNQGHGSAGADIGDSDLSSDSDASGTGETASAGRDTSVADGSDIGVDRIVSGAELGIGANSELIDEPDEQGHRRN
jgi:hypothetical protein